jgi:lipoprotein-anchoring transpeptidase ErfK/SrfK
MIDMKHVRRLVIGLGVIVGVLSLLPWSSAFALGENYVGRQFRQFYESRDGIRILGHPQGGIRTIGGYPSQYFEKGRLEDHRNEVKDGAWSLMYGRLTAELIERAPDALANDTNLTYADLRRASAEMTLVPVGFGGGTLTVDGGVFVPLDARLGVAPGYVVPPYFWSYINRSDLFPGGWLHDVGLPLTNVVSAQTVKKGERRTIVMQAFERTVLTYDPLNPDGWQVERGNIGSDSLRADGTLPPRQAGPKRIEVDLSEQWLYAYNGDELIFDAPVSTGKDGFNTPTGSYKVYLKYRSQTMRGSLGGESWVVPDVPHVMYFNGSVALHGAYWHNNFGTGVRSSHGCVNLPLDAAAVLWDWAPEGTSVIVRN